MTGSATSASAASAALPAARTALPAHRWRSFDLRRGHADHDQVAFLERAGEDVRETAVGGAGADLDGLQFLLRIQHVHRRSLRRLRIASSRQLSGGAGGSTPASAATGALHRIAAATTSTRRVVFAF